MTVATTNRARRRPNVLLLYLPKLCWSGYALVGLRWASSDQTPSGARDQGGPGRVRDHAQRTAAGDQQPARDELCAVLRLEVAARQLELAVGEERGPVDDQGGVAT